MKKKWKKEYKLIFKYFVDSIFSTNKYKNFDFKLNANKNANISPEKSTTFDSLIDSEMFLDWYVKRY